MSSRRTAVTLIEVLIFAAMIGVGVAVSGSAGRQFGVLGYVGGFFVGTLGAFAAFFAFGYTVAFTIGLLTGVPEYPVCSNGKEKKKREEKGSGPILFGPRFAHEFLLIFGTLFAPRPHHTEGPSC